jgi:hypothetical protein
LLPTGSAAETNQGISHLFEHILIARSHRLFPQSRVRGHTTEDYVILFGRGLTAVDMGRVLKEMSLAPEEIESEKEGLIGEIEQERHREEEFFFRFVWQGTDYEKTPLGQIEAVRAIGVALLEGLRAQLLHMPLYFYTGDSGLQIVNPPAAAGMPPTSLNIRRRRSEPFGDTHYHIYYFNGQIEAMYLLERVLKKANPDHHVQLSEKKRESALIVQQGARFPTGDTISSLKESVLREIRHEVSGIQENFDEKALNELESVYFYNTRWSQRLDRLFRTSDRQLLTLAARLAES